MNVKLMKGLQECIRGHECQKCPYFLTSDCRARLLADAEELLKEQEPVKPHKIPHSITYPVGAYVCGNCNIRILEPDDDFCPNCGRAVKWDE